MLTERREQLLRFIVEEHVRSAQPVPSAALARKRDLGVSSATIRNEMARLEEDGFIVQPHTSAGRIPTDKGYRYYVETLMQPRELPASVRQTIRHQFHQAEGAVSEWAHLAAAVLAARLSYAALVTVPHAVRPRLRWLQLVSVHDYLALLLVVLREARVLKQTIPLERPVSQDELTESAVRLNSLYAGLSARHIRAATVEHLALEAEAVRHLLELMEAAEDESFGETYIEGLPEMLREPEFTQGQRVLALLELLEQPSLPQVIPMVRSEGKVTVVIGSEHPNEAMRQCSVIVSPYSGSSGLRGTVSVLGPTRMQYSRAVPMVRYMSSIMEELLDAYFN